MTTSQSPSDSGRGPAARPARLAVPIFGLSLGACGADQLERRLQSEPGVRAAYVNRANDTAYITYDPAHVTAARLCSAIEAAGLRTGAPETWRPLG